MLKLSPSIGSEHRSFLKLHILGCRVFGGEESEAVANMAQEAGIRRGKERLYEGREVELEDVKNGVAPPDERGAGPREPGPCLLYASTKKRKDFSNARTLASISCALMCGFNWVRLSTVRLLRAVLPDVTRGLTPRRSFNSYNGIGESAILDDGIVSMGIRFDYRITYRRAQRRQKSDGFEVSVVEHVRMFVCECFREGRR